MERVVECREHFSIDSLSANSRIWKVIVETVREASPEDSIVIDLELVTLLGNTWESVDFQELVVVTEEKHLNVRFILDSRQVGYADNLKVYLACEGSKIGVSVGSKGKWKVEDTKVTHNVASENLMKCGELMPDGTFYIKSYEKYKNITVNTFAHTLGDMLSKYSKEYKKITLDLGLAKIEKSARVSISKVCNEYENFNIVGEYSDVLDVSINYSKEFSTEEKIMMWRELPDGEVGFLSRYKNSRTLDETGRRGAGEVVESSVAIYRGVVGDEIVMEVVSNDYLYTKEEWYVDNNGEDFPGLVTNIIKIESSDVGLLGDFLGERCQFLSPVQEEDSQYIDSILVENGSVTGIKVLLPVYVKNVLDESELEYNREGLIEAIQESKIYMKDK